jgi:hypothetical protein
MNYLHPTKNDLDERDYNYRLGRMRWEKDTALKRFPPDRADYEYSTEYIMGYYDAMGDQMFGQDESDAS